MEKVVKCRKEHSCCFCNRKILVGEIAEFFNIKLPKYDKNDKQIGIEYISGYLCKKTDCVEVGNRLINPDFIED